MDSKTYVFGEQGSTGVLSALAPFLQKSGIDPSVLALMNNRNNGFGEGGWFMWIIFLFFLMGWGNNGWGNRGNGSGLSNEINNDYGRDLLMQAINGNRTAISELATNLNCSTGQIQTAINGVMSQVQSVASQVGQSGLQVINAIQSGNQTIAAQLADCCCKTQNAITTQGYESRLATQEQTAILGSKVDGGTSQITQAIANQTTLINDKFCQLEMREMQSKIDALREKNSTLVSQLSNEHQTAQVLAGQQAVVAPLQTSLADLTSRLAKIESTLPPTVAVPYPQLQAYNPEVARAAAYGAYAADSVYGVRATSGC